jgi:hypothetical protein
MPQLNPDFDVISQPAMPPPLPAPLVPLLAPQPSAESRELAKISNPGHNAPRGDQR